jgi:hypothetical protein
MHGRNFSARGQPTCEIVKILVVVGGETRESLLDTGFLLGQTGSLRNGWSIKKIAAQAKYRHAAKCSDLFLSDLVGPHANLHK